MLTGESLLCVKSYSAARTCGGWVPNATTGCTAGDKGAHLGQGVHDEDVHVQEDQIGAAAQALQHQLLHERDLRTHADGHDLTLSKDTLIRQLLKLGISRLASLASSLPCCAALANKSLHWYRATCRTHCTVSSL